MAAVVTVFMISITNQLLTAVLGVYFTDINHSVLGAGMHLSIFAVGTLTGKAFLLLHRPVESRILVKAGMGITIFASIGYLLGGFWHPFCPVAVWVSFFRMVQGIGFSFAASASPILITGYSKGQLSGKISNYGMITTFATLIGNPLALRIYAGMAEQKAFLLICLLVLICAACAVILCPKTEEAVGAFQGFSKETSGSEVKKWIPFIGGLFLLFFFSQILTSIFNVLVPIYAKQMGRLELASVFLMVVTAAMLVIRIGIPALLRKMGFRRFVMTGCILYVAGILCCLAAESVRTGIMMISGGILGGVASGIFMSVFHIKMLSVVPEELYGKVNIIFLLAIDFSLIVSGTFWSLLVNRFGLHEAFCLAAVMGLLPGLCCIVKPKSLCRSAE